MIIFMNGRHTFVEADANEPIVWVDAQDATTYTLSGNDVLTLDNKGSLGGAMTLNGTVKFANNGFESWSGSDFITRDLGEPFLPNNNFTMSFTFDTQNLTGGASNLNTIGTITSSTSNDNSIGVLFSNNGVIDMWTKGSGSSYDYNKTLTSGLKTVIFSYDLNTGIRLALHYDGGAANSRVFTFNNVTDNLITLLNSNITGWGESGANNPLHEFRLYNRAFDLTEMQDLQTELNNKYTP